jgi:hypothetical protein
MQKVAAYRIGTFEDQTDSRTSEQRGHFVTWLPGRTAAPTPDRRWSTDTVDKVWTIIDL